METVGIEIVSLGGEILNGRLQWDYEPTPGEDEVTVAVEMEKRRYEATAETFFEALVMVRREMEGLGLFPKCNGALENVYPSGMCLSMGEGRKAYRLTLGRHARMTDLVDIFGPPEATDGVLATVDDQERFYERWLSSPRQHG